MDLPNVLGWNTSTKGHRGSIKIESKSRECNGISYVINIDGNTRKYDLSAIGMNDTSHEWIVQLEGLEYGTDIFYYLHDRAAQAANMRSDFLAEPSRRILALLNGMKDKTSELEANENKLNWASYDSPQKGWETEKNRVIYRIIPHQPPLNITINRHWKLERCDTNDDPFEWILLNTCMTEDQLKAKAQKDYNRIINNQPAGFIVENGMQGEPLCIPFNMRVDDNPKTQFGVAKPPMWYVPGVAMFKAGLAHMHGALKYGHFNWREKPMSSSVLINAAFRHMFAWKEGEDCAQDSGIDHLAHAAACLNILMDAQHYGNLNDDRHDSVTDFNKLFEESKPIIKQIEQDAAALHASKTTNS